MGIGKNIKLLLDDNEMTVSELSEKIHINRGSIYSYIRRDSSKWNNIVTGVSALFNMTPQELREYHLLRSDDEVVRNIVTLIQAIDSDILISEEKRGSISYYRITEGEATVLVDYSELVLLYQQILKHSKACITYLTDRARYYEELNKKEP